MKKLTIKEIEDITKLYNNGKNAKEIGEMIGVKRDSLARWLKQRPEIVWRGKRSYKINESYFDVASQNVAYFLGFICADGHVHKYGCEIELQIGDIDILEKFKKELDYNGPITFSTKTTSKGKIRNYCRLRISSKKIAEKLMSFGILSDKTFLLGFNLDIIKNNLSHFMRGFFDGDGCLCSCFLKDGYWRHIVTIVAEKEFSHKLKDMIEAATGISFRLKENRKVINCLVLESHPLIKKFLEWIYDNADVKLNRKYQKYLNFVKIYSEHNKDSAKKLTNNEIVLVRDLLKNGLTQREISIKFNVSRSTIASIKSNRNYNGILTSY